MLCISYIIGSRRYCSPAADVGVSPSLSTPPPPYHRRTNAAISSDFRTKSEDIAAMVLSWYGDGTTMVGVICVRGGADGRA